jgi:methionyl-tRNA formyltransferase/MoaA/NifB/PqqE/SkfB family radical SAM enzyme
MKVVLYALTGFGNEALRALLGAGCEVGAVVTRREEGPHPYYSERNLADEAREAGIATFEVDALNDPALIEHVQAFAPELVVNATFHLKLNARLIRMASRCAVGVHPSLLPRGRGATPTAWTLIEGADETGVSLYRLTPRPFDGDIIALRPLTVDKRDTEGTLRQRLARLGGEMLATLVRELEGGKEPAALPYDPSHSTTYPPRSRRDALISFDDSTVNVHNRIRGTNPWPGAHLVHQGKELRVLEARPVPGQSFEVTPGLVTDFREGWSRVKTADGLIDIRLEGGEALVGAVLGEKVMATVTSCKGGGQGQIAHTRESYGLEEGAEEFPRMIVLAVAYPCNAKCPNCPYTEGNSDIRKHYIDAQFIDADLFKKIARECGQFGAYLRITGGGEPMLHPADMVSLVEYAREVGARVWLNTNGSLFTEEKLDRLLACGLDQIEFSVDAADPETYAIVRAGLDFDNLVASVRYMLDRRNKTGARTNIVVSVINQDLLHGTIDTVAKFWLDLGVDEVIRRKFLTWGANTTLDSLHSADETPYLDKLGGDPCPFPFHRLNIDSRGKIEVCGYDISGRTNFGSVREKTIQEIWRGPMFEWWRNMHLQRRGREIPLCRECPDWAYRSWNHNWQKVLKTATTHRESTIEGFDVDEVGVMSETVKQASAEVGG